MTTTSGGADAAGEIARGRRAAAILDDPLVRAAFAALQEAAIAEWRRAPARDVEGRERLWLMLKLAERLEAHFTGLVENGKLAGERLAEIAKERRLKLFG